MKWFWRYVWNKMKQIGDEPIEKDEILQSGTYGIGASVTSARSRDHFEGDSGLNMRVYKAIGGRIISFSHYDRRTDRENRSVYIITDEQDFERELGKIITIESMRG